MVKMSSELSKQEYLKRYLENEKNLNRKRKREPMKKVRVSRDKADEDDEKPVVAEIIDERPIEEKIKELYKSSRWKKIDDEYPVYTGPAAPSNRFGILSGYRWDGVDRSNGFEKKYFEKVNTSKAVETEAYQWSIQDM